MKRLIFWFTVLISGALCLWTGLVLGYTFPEKPAARFGKGTIEEVAYSPDGKLLAVSGSIGIWLYDAENLNEVKLLEGHIGKVNSVAFSPDGRILASGSDDLTIRLWNVQTQKQVATLKEPDWVYSIAFSPDGKLLASGSWDGTVRLWDVQRKKQIAILKRQTNDIVYSVAFSPDGKILASGSEDKTVRLWNVATRRQVAILEGHEGYVFSVAFSPDGKILASGSEDRTVCLWDVAMRKQVAILKGHEGYVFSVAFSPDGRILASVAGDGVRIWDVQQQKQVTVLKHKYGVSVAFSPDGKILASGSWDRTVRLWDVQRKKQIAILKGQTNDIVYSVAFSPDGKILALGCGLTVRPGGEATVRLWDIDEQQEVAILHGHKDNVYSVAFSRNGRWLASGSQDGTVLLWRVNLPSPYQPVGAKGKQPIILGGLKRTMLLQNFPNPFNAETWIPYHLTEETPVTIRIYDARGRLVRRLELGQKTAGAYLTKETAAYWDGRNELGESMASGLYFYRLNAGEFTATRRMFVVK